MQRLEDVKYILENIKKKLCHYENITNENLQSETKSRHFFDPKIENLYFEEIYQNSEKENENLGDEKKNLDNAEEEKIINTSSELKELMKKNSIIYKTLYKHREGDKNQNDNTVQKLKIENELENSFHFRFSKAEISVDTEELWKDEFLNKTIDEAIDKYQKSDEEKFKEASVQTISTSSIPFQCQCNINVSKYKNLKFSEKYFDTEKSKVENKERSSVNYQNINYQKEISKLPTIEEKIDGETTSPIPSDKIPCFFKTATRIRVGLSKRAKFQSLHNKLIY